jgi:alpha-ketoglutarate-dependent taurine dioxygenase
MLTTTNQSSPVNVGFIREADKMPVVISAKMPGISFVEWGGNNKDMLQEYLAKFGAVLLRNFAMGTVIEFQQFILEAFAAPVAYADRNAVRSKKYNNIFTSTDAPAEHKLRHHCENSFSMTWPGTVFFYCLEAAEQGGQTPIADVANVFRRLDARVREPFLEKGVKYVRNLGLTDGLSWQYVFQTEDPEEMKRACAASAIECEWFDAQKVRISQIRPAAIYHPGTGLPVWFNQADSFNILNAGKPARDFLLSKYSIEGLPRNSYYGDGATIGMEAISAIHRAYEEESICFDWLPGDLLILDNLKVAHGRNPYIGQRKIVVGMTNPGSWNDVKIVGKGSSGE